MNRQYSNFGTYLCAMRKRAGLTLRDLGKRIGFSPAYLNDVEKGRRYPFSFEKLQKLVLILELDEEEANTMFDLAGLSRNDIPADIVEYLAESEGMYKMIRELREMQTTEEDLRFMLAVLRKERESGEKRCAGPISA